MDFSDLVAAFVRLYIRRSEFCTAHNGHCTLCIDNALYFYRAFSFRLFHCLLDFAFYNQSKSADACLHANYLVHAFDITPGNYRCERDYYGNELDDSGGLPKRTSPKVETLIYIVPGTLPVKRAWIKPCTRVGSNILPLASTTSFWA